MGSYIYTLRVTNPIRLRLPSEEIVRVFPFKYLCKPYYGTYPGDSVYKTQRMWELHQEQAEQRWQDRGGVSPYVYFPGREDAQAGLTVYRWYGSASWDDGGDKPAIPIGELAEGRGRAWSLDQTPYAEELDTDALSGERQAMVYEFASATVRRGVAGSATLHRLEHELRRTLLGGRYVAEPHLMLEFRRSLAYAAHLVDNGGVAALPART